METTPGRYEFAGGYPTPETVRRAYDEADLNRAVQAYRFFYPSVSIMATWKGNLRAGSRQQSVRVAGGHTEAVRVHPEL